MGEKQNLMPYSKQTNHYELYKNAYWGNFVDEEIIKNRNDFVSKAASECYQKN